MPRPAIAPPSRRGAADTRGREAPALPRASPSALGELGELLLQLLDAPLHALEFSLRHWTQALERLLDRRLADRHRLFHGAGTFLGLGAEDAGHAAHLLLQPLAQAVGLALQFAQLVAQLAGDVARLLLVEPGHRLAAVADDLPQDPQRHLRALLL